MLRSTEENHIVTLSDSFSSHNRNRALKGNIDVVCIDSDTESDGSFSNLVINKSTAQAVLTSGKQDLKWSANTKNGEEASLSVLKSMDLNVEHPKLGTKSSPRKTVSCDNVDGNQEEPDSEWGSPYGQGKSAIQWSSVLNNLNADLQDDQDMSLLKYNYLPSRINAEVSDDPEKSGMKWSYLQGCSVSRRVSRRDISNSSCSIEAVHVRETEVNSEDLELIIDTTPMESDGHLCLTSLASCDRSLNSFRKTSREALFVREPLSSDADNREECEQMTGHSARVYDNGGDCHGNSEENIAIGGESSDSENKRQKLKSGGGMKIKPKIVDWPEKITTVRESEKERKLEERLKKKHEEEEKKRRKRDDQAEQKRLKEEEKKRQQEERKLKNEEEKKRKQELKAEAAERKKLEREKSKWEKGKFALQSITVFIDTKVVEGGLIGGHLLSCLAEKGYKYSLVSNPVKKTVLWRMKGISRDGILSSDADDSQGGKDSSGLKLEDVEVPYAIVVLEAEEFSTMVAEGSLERHICSIQERHAGFTICYLVNKLMWYLHKRDQQKYKKPEDCWVRPPVEQALAKLVTNFDGVHSRLCLDEAEIADHITGLTRSLALCPFKCRLTALSLSANGDHVVKGDPNRDIIKRNTWLKALVAIPKVSGSCAIAIAKKYPSMQALYKAYLDPLKSVHEKEFLLQDLMKEGISSDVGRRVGPACSRRVYRILMAQNGHLCTADVEEGADFFED